MKCIARLFCRTSWSCVKGDEAIDNNNYNRSIVALSSKTKVAAVSSEAKQLSSPRAVDVDEEKVIFQLQKGLSLVVVRGSVTSFGCSKSTTTTTMDDGQYAAAGAIVNATNEFCIGGGGVDGAINRLGGPNMREDRRSLPIIVVESEEEETTRPIAMTTTSNSMGRKVVVPLVSSSFQQQQNKTKTRRNIRCKTGNAVLTGPNEYGSLKVSYVVHAVGPNYRDYPDDDTQQFDQLLQSAYKKSLECCCNNTTTTEIRQVAFSLISSGLYRGNRSLRDVIELGVLAIRDWALENNSKDNFGALERILLYGYRRDEYNTLVEICQEEFQTAVAIKNGAGRENTNMLTEREDRSKEEEEDGPLDSYPPALIDISKTQQAKQLNLSS